MTNITATINATFSEGVLADIHTHWITMGSSAGSLGIAAGPTDTILTLSAPVNGLSAGDTVVIDGEPMSITAVGTAGDNTLTVVRYATAFPEMATVGMTPNTTHALGASLIRLVYPTAWLMIAVEALLPWAQRTVMNLGADSATFGSSATGSLAINSN